MAILVYVHLDSSLAYQCSADLSDAVEFCTNSKCGVDLTAADQAEK